MEKITKALIEEINDITSYSDLIKLQKLIDVVIYNDFRNSEKIRSAVAETKKKVNTTNSLGDKPKMMSTEGRCTCRRNQSTAAIVSLLVFA